MSEENVELVRKSFAVWRDVDRQLVDRQELWRFLSPEGVWEMGTFSGWPGQSEFRGDEFFAFRESWTEVFEEWSYEVEQVLDAGGNEVVVTLYQRGRPRGGDGWVDMRYGIIYTVEAGLIQRARVYASPDEALDAAGLQK